MVDLKEYWDVEYKVLPTEHPKLFRILRIYIKNHSPNKRKFRVKLEKHTLENQENIIKYSLYGINAPEIIEIDKYKKGYVEYSIPILEYPENQIILTFTIENLDKGDKKYIDVEII